MTFLRQKSFTVFTLFYMSMKLFYMKVQDGACSNMDLRESMRGSAKITFCEGLRVQLATKLFCLES